MHPPSTIRPDGGQAATDAEGAIANEILLEDRGLPISGRKLLVGGRACTRARGGYLDAPEATAGFVKAKSQTR